MDRLQTHFYLCIFMVLNTTNKKDVGKIHTILTKIPPAITNIVKKRTIYLSLQNRFPLFFSVNLSGGSKVIHWTIDAKNKDMLPNYFANCLVTRSWLKFFSVTNHSTRPSRSYSDVTISALSVSGDCMYVSAAV